MSPLLPHLALEGHAYAKPEAIALRWLDAGAPAVLTYGELHRRARAIASGLREVTAHGDRVLLFLESGLELAEAFFACLFGGRIAVPLAAPLGRAAEAHRRVATVLGNCGASLAIVSEALRSRFLEGAGANGLPPVPAFYITPHELSVLGEQRGEVGPSLHATAFLQYTSGSTAAPKGVIVGHAELADNALRIRERFGFSQETRGLSWLPTHHDMGLVGCVVQPICTGFECSLMSPLSFVQRPLRWLQAVSDLHITGTGGPCFAYELCVRRIREEACVGLDLSSWRTAFVGAERVRPDVLRAFSQKFQGAGFDSSAFAPCYGLAEATLMVAAQPAGRGVSSLRLSRLALSRGDVRPGSEEDLVESVSCGPVVGGHELLIVDPDTRRALPEGCIGEVWVAGPSVAQGYFGDVEETAGAFHGALAGDAECTYLRTGDQGFVSAGNLHICGRLKTLIIIRGQNFAPEDIEHLLQLHHPALASHAGVAFSVDSQAGEQLVVVHEVERRFLGTDLRALVEQAQDLLGRELGLRAADFLLVKPGTIPRTTSGKLKRLACRDVYLQGGLSATASPSSSIAVDAMAGALRAGTCVKM